MPSDTVISVENLSKSYLIGHDGPQERYHSLRDTIVRHGRNYVRKAIDMARGRQIIQGDSVEEFWALKDVSFDVKRGEVLGIIGRNGAGKSTLLKILSRITEPTSGRVVLDGRVASLLEVGTGFHPELTGRENIYLNGSILGMTRSEIKDKFDEIVEFAGVEIFLDTPVKRYSSGMYVRLAFAVAAHLEPEILIVDEVLAVGDSQFQKKCLAKMDEVAQGGRTVLFVSHNMSALQSLCTRGILLNQGYLQADQTASMCVQEYLQQQTGLDAFEREENKSSHVCISSGNITVKHEDNQSDIFIKLNIWSDQKRKVSLDLRLSESAGNPVGYGSLGSLISEQSVNIESGDNGVEFCFSANHLANGIYSVSLDVTLPGSEYLDRMERCLSFELERAIPKESNAVLLQRWGYGSLEIPLFPAKQTETYRPRKKLN